MAWSHPSRGRAPSAILSDLDLAPDVHELPFVARETMPTPEFVRYLVFVAAWGVGAYSVWTFGESLTDRVFFVFFAALGVAVLRGVVWPRAFPTRWRFTRSDVECRKRRLLGWEEWTEPLSSYLGVVASETDFGGYFGLLTLYSLRLQHREDSGRSVTLYRSRSPLGFRRKHEHYGRLFGLACLIEGASGLEQRELADLELPVRERAASGGLPAAIDVSAPPAGKNMGVGVEGDALRICARKRPLVLASSFIVRSLISTGALLVLFGLTSPFGPTLLSVLTLVVGTASISLGVGLYIFLRYRREEILVSQRQVRRHWQFLGLKWAEETVATGDIREVVVSPIATQKQHTVIHVLHTAGDLQFGWGLTQAQNEWVRDCIVAVISK